MDPSMPPETRPPVRFTSISEIPSRFWTWPNFSPREVMCKGTGMILVVPEFLDRMQALRSTYGKPLAVSSWYRSPEHNVRVSNTGPNGPHTTGRAVDLKVVGADALLLFRLALNLNFTGVGVKQHGEGRFLHLDDLSSPGFSGPRPWLWSYA
jgi:hypothetical protein